MLVKTLQNIQDQKISDLSVRLEVVKYALIREEEKTPGLSLRFDVAICVFEKDPAFLAKLIEEEFRQLMLKAYDKGERMDQEILAELYLTYYKNYNKVVCELDAIYDGVIREIWQENYSAFCEQMTQKITDIAKFRIKNFLTYPYITSIKDKLLYQKNGFMEEYANFRYLHLLVNEVDQQLANLSEDDALTGVI